MLSDQTAPPGAALAEWRAYWPLIFVSWIGCGLMGVPILSLGAFVEPLQKAFSWTRTDIWIGSMVYAAVGVIGSPLAGRLIDRWGTRRVVLPGVILTGIAFGLFGTAGKLLLTWIALWTLYSAAGQLILMQAWTAAVASNFIAGRGLALAVTLTGSAVTATLIPRTAVWLISSYGWRAAYGVMGLVWAAGGGLLVFLLFHSKQDDARRGGASAAEAGSSEALAGVSAREGLRSATFVKIAVAALFSEIVIVGVVASIIPMVHERGLSLEDAAWVAGVIGASAVVGKLICGAIVQRVGGQYIMAFLLALPLATALILLQPNTTMLSGSVATGFLGFSSGGLLEMLVYLVARHFGLRAFGTIFGVIGGVLSLALGVGPVIAGRVYDLTHSYDLMLIADIPLSLVSVALMLVLGDYPDRLPAPGPALAEAAE